MQYFAYGSNMSLRRMRSRVPSAAVMGVFALGRHSLQFHKVGMDGSAKCDAHFTGNSCDSVEGVVYVLDPAEIVLLDKAEGLGRGYAKQEVEVIGEYGCSTLAFTYFATRIDAALRPVQWYKHHVATGAKQHGLSDGYVSAVESVAAVPDADAARRRLELAIYEQEQRHL